MAEGDYPAELLHLPRAFAQRLAGPPRVSLDRPSRTGQSTASSVPPHTWQGPRGSSLPKLQPVDRRYLIV
jgi:hypothetical protein